MTKRRFPDLRPNGWDGLVVLAVAVLLLASGLWVLRGSGSGDHLTAILSVDGEERQRIDLSRLQAPEEQTLEANGYTLSIVFSPEGAEIRESDCPTQDCVRTGTITRPGQSIVCLPARVSIQLTGADSGDGLDAVIG